MEAQKYPARKINIEIFQVRTIPSAVTTDLGPYVHDVFLPLSSILHSQECPLAWSLLGGLEASSTFRRALIWEANDKARFYKWSFAHSPKFAFKSHRVIFGFI